MSISTASWVDHLLVGLILVVIPVFAVFVGQRSMKRVAGDFTTGMRIGTYWSNSAFLWLLVGLCVGATLLGDRPLADLGLRPPSGEHLLWSLALLLLFVVGFALDVFYDSRPSRVLETALRFQRTAPFMPWTHEEFRHSLVLLVSAGICEEIVYRGYVIPYLMGYTQSNVLGSVVAVTLPALAFGFAHLYQGIYAVLKIIGMAIALGGVFVLMRSLWLPILLHLSVDVFGALYGMWLVRKIAKTGDALEEAGEGQEL